MEIKDIRAALAAACRTVVDGTGAALEASAFIADSIDPPFAYPVDSGGTFDVSMDGLADATVTLRVLTSRSEDQAGQELLDDFLASTGETSIKAAVEADPTLGGECSDLHVSGWSGYQLYEVAGTDYYGAELTVEVLG